MVKLASAPGQTPQHATTILFTDIVGSSQYFVSRGNDAGMAMIERHNRLLFPLIASAGGRVVKTIGDAIFATFEDPAQAVGCAWAMQDTLKRANAEVSNEDHLDVRMGLHYGMVFEKENDAFGDAVNMAQRVQSKATGGQVLLSR